MVLEELNYTETKENNQLENNDQYVHRHKSHEIFQETKKEHLETSKSHHEATRYPE